MSEPCDHDVEEKDLRFATRCHGREVRLEAECPKCGVVLATITIYKDDTNKFSITHCYDSPKKKNKMYYQQWVEEIVNGGRFPFGLEGDLRFDMRKDSDK